MADEGIHIRAMFLYNPENEDETMIRVEVWPLPNDKTLHEALSIACHDAAKKILIERGLSGEDEIDLTAKGPAQ